MARLEALLSGGRTISLEHLLLGTLRNDQELNTAAVEIILVHSGTATGTSRTESQILKVARAATKWSQTLGL
jgi:hypothetical protein